MSYLDQVVCPQVRQIMSNRNSMFERMLTLVTSDESLPVYEIEAVCNAPTWGVRLQFGFVFDEAEMKWRLARHNDVDGFVGPVAFGEVKMHSVHWAGGVPARQLAPMIQARTMKQVYEVARQVVLADVSELPGL